MPYTEGVDTAVAAFATPYQMQPPVINALGTISSPPPVLESDVRNGVTYNNGIRTGDVVLPIASDVQAGYGYGTNGTEFTGSAGANLTLNVVISAGMSASESTNLTANAAINISTKILNNPQPSQLFDDVHSFVQRIGVSTTLSNAVFDSLAISHKNSIIVSTQKIIQDLVTISSKFNANPQSRLAFGFNRKVTCNITIPMNYNRSVICTVKTGQSEYSQNVQTITLDITR